MKIFLHGQLGKAFGRRWNLNVRSPKEALKAIEANREDFRPFLIKKHKEGVRYKVFIDKTPLNSKEEMGLELNDKKEIHFLPLIKGRGYSYGDSFNANPSQGDYFRDGAITYGISALIGMGGEYVSEEWGWELVGDFAMGLSDIGKELGMSMIMQGAIMGLMPDMPDPPSDESVGPTQKSTSSFIFSRPLNNITQGAPVPIGYGRLRVGSHVISSSLLNTQLVALNSVFASTTSEDGSIEGAVSIDQYSTSG